MPTIVTFKIEKGTDKKKIVRQLSKLDNFDASKDKNKLLAKLTDQYKKEYVGYTITPVISNGIVEAKDNTTIYMNDRKADVKVKDAYMKMLSGQNDPPEFEEQPEYYATAEEADEKEVRDYAKAVAKANTRPKEKKTEDSHEEAKDETPEDKTFSYVEKNEFGAEGGQEAFTDVPKKMTERPEPEQFGYDNAFDRKKYEDKARKAYLKLVNKTALKAGASTVRKEKEFDKILDKYKKHVVKEALDAEKVYEDQRMVIMTPTSLRSTPAFMREYGRGTEWLKEDKHSIGRKVFVAIDKTKDPLCDSSAKTLMVSEGKKMLVVDSKGRKINLAEAGISMSMLDRSLKSVNEDAGALADGNVVFENDKVAVVAVPTLSGIYKQIADVRTSLGVEPWKAIVRRSMVKNGKNFIVVDKKLADSDPGHKMFMTVIDGKAEMVDSEDKTIPSPKSALAAKGVKEDALGTMMREGVEWSQCADMAAKARELDCDPVEGCRIIASVRILVTTDGKSVKVVAYNDGEDHENYLRDTLNKAGCGCGDCTCKMTSEPEEEYDVYEFEGI